MDHKQTFPLGAFADAARHSPSCCCSRPFSALLSDLAGPAQKSAHPGGVRSMKMKIKMKLNENEYYILANSHPVAKPGKLMKMKMKMK